MSATACKHANSAPIEVCGVLRDRRLTTIAMPGASYDARLAYPIAILGRSKRNSRKAPFYAPFLFFTLPVVASLFSAFTAGAADPPEAAEATVSASDDARPRAFRPSHHSIKGLAM